MAATIKYLAQSDIGVSILLSELDNRNATGDSRINNIVQNIDTKFIPDDEKTQLITNTNLDNVVLRTPINEDNDFLKKLILFCYSRIEFPFRDMCKIKSINKNNITEAPNLSNFYNGLRTGLVADLPYLKYTKYSLACKLFFLINSDINSIEVELYTTKLFESIAGPWFVKKYGKYSILRNHLVLKKGKTDTETDTQTGTETGDTTGDSDVEMKSIFKDNEDEYFYYSFYENEELLFITSKDNFKTQYVLYMDNASLLTPAQYDTGVSNRNELFKRLNILKLKSFNTTPLKYSTSNCSKLRKENYEDVLRILSKLNIYTWNITNINEPIYIFDRYCGSIVQNLGISNKIPEEIGLETNLELGATPFNYSIIRKNVKNSILENLWQTFLGEKIIRLTLNFDNYSNVDELELYEFYTILMSIAMIFQSNCILFTQRFLLTTPDDGTETGGGGGGVVSKNISQNYFSTLDTNKIIHLNKFENIDYDFNNTIYIEKINNSNDLFICNGNFIMNDYRLSEPWGDNIVSVIYSKSDGAGRLTKCVQDSPFLLNIDSSFIFFEQPTWVINKKKTPSERVAYENFKIVPDLEQLLDLFVNFKPQIIDEINLDNYVSLYRVECESVNYPILLFDMLNDYNNVVTKKNSNLLFKSIKMWIFSKPSQKYIQNKEEHPEKNEKRIKDSTLSVWPYEDILVVKLTEKNYGNIAISTLYSLLTRKRLNLL